MRSIYHASKGDIISASSGKVRIVFAIDRKGKITMPGSRNLCAQIPIDLHQRVCEAREQSGLTTAQYITNLLIEYYEMKENGGKTVMANNTRTMAFQIPEELFQRIKAHLEHETRRMGRKVTQREFVLGLIEEALETAEREVDAASPEPEEPPQQKTDVGSCEIREDGFSHEGVDEVADPDGAENSNLPGDAPADGGSAEDAPSFGAPEGENASNVGGMDHEGEADGGDD